jgi:hypothetical protein
MAGSDSSIFIGSVIFHLAMDLYMMVETQTDHSQKPWIQSIFISLNSASNGSRTKQDTVNLEEEKKL